MEQTEREQIVESVWKDAQVEKWNVSEGACKEITRLTLYKAGLFGQYYSTPHEPEASVPSPAVIRNPVELSILKTRMEEIAARFSEQTTELRNQIIILNSDIQDLRQRVRRSGVAKFIFDEGKDAVGSDISATRFMWDFEENVNKKVEAAKQELSQKIEEVNRKVVDVETLVDRVDADVDFVKRSAKKE